jgi:cell division protein ZapA (FtsZ GTPase activity inhibitor)
MDSIFKNKAEEERVSIIDLKILAVLVTILLKQDLSRLVNRIKLVEL